MDKKYIIKNNPIVQKYIVFLCGSYFRDKPYDKRKILINYINQISDNRISPIIVDEFLSIDDIETENFTIEQYEELVANVSFANFIFLESFSSASELGLFTHSSSINKNIVFYPDNSNLILDKIGYFIKFGILHDSKRISSVPYLALVERFAHGTDFIDEHYYFAKNELPTNIKNKTKEITESIISEKARLNICKTDDTPFSLNFFELAIDDDKKVLYSSSKTAFYILYSILFSREGFDDVVALDIRDKLNQYCSLLEDTILNTICYYDYECKTDYCVKVLNFGSLNDFVCCSLFFIKYMSKRSILSKNIKKALLLNPKDVLTEISYKEKESNLINVPYNLSGVRKTKCIKRFTLYKKHKARSIITYSDLDGKQFRQVHNDISKDLHRICSSFNLYSDCSFAYKKGISTLDCVNKHLESTCFLKMDIHHFFETMSFDILEKKLFEVLSNTKDFILMSKEERIKFRRRLHSYLDVLTINKKFPIGFVTSPIISEIYLSEFDKKIVSICDSLKIVYTRYADDLLFSSKKVFEYDSLENIVVNELNSIGLTINVKKTKKKQLTKKGDSINYIGLNLVLGDTKSFVSIGKTFIKKLAILKAYGYKNSYNTKKVEGLESYLKYNDTSGYEKYRKILRIYNLKDNVKD